MSGRFLRFFDARGGGGVYWGYVWNIKNIKIECVIEALSFFELGLIVGSFLNAAYWRMQEGISFGGRSMCPRCRERISWYDNIPLLSFALLGGKCRSCRAPISRRYPIVECGTGIVFLLLGEAFFSVWDTSSWILTAFLLFSASVLILIFVFDLESMEIPNILLWIGTGAAFVFLLALDATRFSPGASVWSLALHSGLLGALIGFVPLFLLASLSREKWMGMGDGFLAFFLGLIVGFPAVLFSLTLAFFLGALVGISLIALKKKDLQSQVPLGPFLIVGAFLALLLPRWFPGIFEMFPWYW